MLLISITKPKPMKLFTLLSAGLILTLVSCTDNLNLVSSDQSLSETGNNQNAVVIQAAPPSDGPRIELRNLIENVTQATGKRYNAKDNTGKNMDCAKIIANPAGGFISVYHTYVNGVSKVNLATSTNLLDWTWVRELAGSNNGPASQPTIAVAGNGFVMVWEQEPNNHLKFVYFSSWDNLRNGIVAKSFSAPRQLSTCAEGTPNIYSASSTSVDIGFHYYANCDVDRQARGTTNWSSWSSSKQPQFDNAILHWGVKGNVGDRDAFSYKGFNYALIEGQGAKGDFGTWRSYIYDYQTGNADRLNIKTDRGSAAFANPTFTILNLGGQQVVVCTMFIPSQGSGAGEAGELIYYRNLSQGTPGPTFYQHDNFAGNSVSLGRGSYTLSQLIAAGIANDDITSVRVPAGYSVTIYQHDNFGGTSWTLTGDEANLGNRGCNDMLSSVRIN
jgi:hypothetical protein